MDFRKLILYIALLVVGLILWNFWQREHILVLNTDTTITDKLVTNTVPNLINQIQIPEKLAVGTDKSTDYIKVKTDKITVLIDKKGANIVQNALLSYPQEVNKKQPLLLLTNNPQQLYISQSGLTGPEGPDTQQQGPAIYHSASDRYTLQTGQNQLTVDLTWNNDQGLAVTKRYIFYRDKYLVDVLFIAHNSGQHDWTIYPYAQLQRKQPPKESALFHYGLFTGAAISSPQHHYQKLSFSKMSTQPLNETINDGWAAMIQHYFLTAWVPPTGQPYHYYSTHTVDNVYTLGLLGSALKIKPQQTISTGFKLYSGPAIADNLKVVAPHLDLTIDYGWLWFISAGLFWIMKYLHQLLGNWGWAIIALTLLIKLSFYNLSAKSYRSMAQMRRLQPRMQQLKERFVGDKQKLSQATMELYRSEKVNPLSGCLPILVQIPVFISLYYMIVETVALRQAPFILWIHDLSIADPWYILPIIMGGLMFLQQQLNPPVPDPMQQKIMMFLPVVFTVFFLKFPSGLVLYWITNTLLSILQQGWIMRQVAKT